MKTVMMADPVRYPRMTTGEIRETFLLNGLCEPGKLHVNYVDLDHTVVGFAAPTESALTLPTYPELRAEYFLERREIGVLNVGGAGTVSVEGSEDGGVGFGVRPVLIVGAEGVRCVGLDAPR